MSRSEQLARTQKPPLAKGEGTEDTMLKEDVRISPGLAEVEQRKEFHEILNGD